ncbi:MAG: hypothetical protein F6K63_25550 [Moorea sp. SIO1G6]|uniref:Uncharacterized protein n=1 Tax=Moorena producens (strain JHB) TaxID=1454205 RepID=A0A1D9FZ79_MOOP1|nr:MULTISPECIES: hypothetical protein [Moorena]AOY80676.1 hypothetical protein BJP36_12795 [Moorena producens JHB]NET67566.1 hypothetical protein [Moorena sp. SIO1G6]
MANRPRDRVQPNHLQPWPIGHAIAFNQTTFNLQPSTKPPSTFNQTTFNQTTFNLQPSTKQPSTFNQTTFNQTTFNQTTFNLQPNHLQPNHQTGKQPST